MVLTDIVKRSVQGRNAAATQVQTAQYLKPLFKALRARVSYEIPSNCPLYANANRSLFDRP
jgi:hypothetical protein